MSQFWLVVIVAAVVIILAGGYHAWQWYIEKVGDQMTNLDRQ